jgi:outer membrane protein
MKKYLIIIFFIFNIFTFNAYSKIAYIDIKIILNKSNVGKSLNSHLKSLNSEYSKKYTKIEKELLEKEKTLLAQKNIIEKNEFNKKIKNLSDEIDKYKNDKKLSTDKLNKIKIENTKEILRILNPIITKYVENNDISLVLKKTNIIVGKKDLDITEKIIKLLNGEINKLNF